MADGPGTRVDVPDGVYVVAGGEVVEALDRDEVAMLYHHSFYGTNAENPLPPGHPPSKTATAQMKLALALDEPLPDEQLRQVQEQINSARQRALDLQVRHDEAQRQREAGAAAVAEADQQDR